MYELTIYFLHWHEGKGERFYRVGSLLILNQEVAKTEHRETGIER
jgi:hypothetical protein